MIKQMTSPTKVLSLLMISEYGKKLVRYKSIIPHMPFRL